MDKLQEVLDLIFSSAEPPVVKNAILKLNTDQKEYFRRAVALWACHYGFDDLVPKKNEMVIPQELREYRIRRRASERVSLSPEFWTREDISTYVDNDKVIEQKNKDNLDWLKSIHDWLDADKDHDFRLMVEGRIHEFEEFERTPEAREVARSFGGSVV